MRDELHHTTYISESPAVTWLNAKQITHKHDSSFHQRRLAHHHAIKVDNAETFYILSKWAQVCQQECIKRAELWLAHGKGIK